MTSFMYSPLRLTLYKIIHNHDFPGVWDLTPTEVPDGCCVSSQTVYYDKCSITGSNMVLSGKHGGGSRRGNGGNLEIQYLSKIANTLRLRSALHIQS